MRKALPIIVVIAAFACSHQSLDSVGKRSSALIGFDFEEEVSSSIVPSQEAGLGVPGGFSVGDTGAANYDMDLWVPPGRVGVEPSLGLRYDHRSGNGLLGVGFSLTGLGAITRCAPFAALDGKTDGIHFDSRDRFCLDGVRLQVLPEGPGYGGDGAEYRTEEDAIARIVSYGQLNGAPEYFRVWLKSGRIRTYGQREGTLVHGGEIGDTVAWYLTKEEDRSGNYITYHYEWDALGLGTEIYPVEIRYTGGPVELELEPQREVRFVYGMSDRPDTWTHYVDGVERTVRRRIEAIEMYAPNPTAQQLVRRYELTYANDSITERSRVAAIKECDGGGACLPGPQFGWSLGSWEHETLETGLADFGLNGAFRVEFADIDGDYRDDLIFARGVDPENPEAGLAGLFVRFSTGNGFGPEYAVAAEPTNYSVAEFRLMDLDTDPGAEISILEWVPGQTPPNSRRFVDWSGSSFFVAESVTPYWDPGGELVEQDEPAYFVDLDGDGLQDMTSAVWDTTGPAQGFFMYRLNQGGSFGPYVQTSVDYPSEHYSYGAAMNAFGFPRAQVAHHGWIEGPRTVFHFDELGNPTQSETLFDSVDRSELLLDANGDGLTDKLGLRDGDVEIQVNDGKLFHEYAWALTGGPPLQEFWANDRDLVEVGDFNRDGRTDYLRTDHNFIYLSHGTTFEAFPIGFAPGNNTVGGPLFIEAEHTRVLDIDGDGLLDVAQFEGGADPGVYPGELVVHRRSGDVPDRLVRVENGLGAAVEIDYATTADENVYSDPVSSCFYPTSCNARGVEVVSEVRQLQPSGAAQRFTYTYQSSRAALNGYGWLGFSQVEMTDQQTGRVVATGFNNTTHDEGQYFLAGKPSVRTVDVTLASGEQHHRHTIFERDLRRRPDAETVYRVELERVTSYYQVTPAGSGTARTVWNKQRDLTYDDYHNVLTVLDAVSSGTHSGRSTSSTYTYDTDDANWLVGMRRRLTVSSSTPGGATSTRMTERHHDALGRLYEVVVEPDNPALKLTTTYQLDPAGLVLSATTQDVYGTTRNVVFDGYDDDPERMYPRSVNRGLGEAYFAVHPAHGLVVVSEDENSVIDRVKYDGFGRVRELHTASGAVHETDYSDDPTTPLVITRRYDDDGVTAHGGTEIIEHDSLGREVLRSATGMSGTSFLQTEYDDLGRVDRVSRPYFTGETLQWTQFTYDEMDRTVAVLQPDGGTSTVGFETAVGGAGVVTSIVRRFDAEGDESFVELDLHGDILRSVEVDVSGGPRNEIATAYTYGSFGELDMVIDPEGNVVDHERDDWGRVVEVLDPDTGVTEITYTTFGELDTVTDAVGNVDAHFYDPLGRIDHIDSDEDGTTEYTWDTAPNGIGQLASATSGDGVVTSYQYDSVGRLATAVWSIFGESFQLDHSYNQSDQLTRLDYPAVPGGSRMRVDYAYHDGSGALEEVTTSGSTLWAADSRVADGQIEQETFGNAVTTSRSYKAATGLIDQIWTRRGATDLQRLEHNHGLDGTLASRHDDVAGRTETFGYDGLDRIKSWVVDVGGGDFTTSYDYHDSGNLDTVTREGATETYGYGEGAAGPHAVTSIDGDSYGYDMLGRQTSGPDRTVSYTGFDLPRTVSRGGLTTSFAYDAANRRVGKWNSQMQTVYIGDVYERRTAGGETAHVHKVFAEGRVVAQWTWNASSMQATYRYLHDDHLGSTSVATDEYGNGVERTFHEPFGRRTDASGAPVPDPLPSVEGLHIGFTGHEHDDELGLINMRGRMYDPKTRRFLSADPVVSDPLGGQHWNPYSYVANQPTAFTDPSGFAVEGTQQMPEGPGSTPTCFRGTCGDPDPPSNPQPTPDYPASGQSDDSGTSQPAPGETDGPREYQDHNNPSHPDDPDGSEGDGDAYRRRVLDRAQRGLRDNLVNQSIPGVAHIAIANYNQAVDPVGYAEGLATAPGGTPWMIMRGLDTLEMAQTGTADPDTVGEIIAETVHAAANGIAALSMVVGGGPRAPRGHGRFSPVPESYMDPRLLVDMEPARGLPGSTSTSLGQVRNANFFWRELLARNSEMFSRGNAYRITELGLAPRVNSTWVRYNPTHVSFVGQVLEHHHLARGRMAIPLPRVVHQTWTRVLHQLESR